MLPWKETSAESERMRFIELKATGVETVADLCRWFGISRKTAYKLIGRYEAHGRDSLRDRSRASHRHANATPRDVAERIVKAKRAHPSWGPKKLVAWLRSGEPDVAWPAPSTASGILDRAGLVKRRKRRRRSSPWDEPFAGTGLGSLSPLAVWWVKLGIVPSASSRDGPNRTGASSDSSELSRRRRRHHPWPTGNGSGGPSTASGKATTLSVRMKHWGSGLRRCCTRHRSAPILTASATRSTEPGSRFAACAATVRSSGRETSST